MNETATAAENAAPTDVRRQPAAVVRFPVEVVVVAGPDRGGPVVVAGRVYLTMPRPGEWRNRVIGMAAVSDTSAVDGGGVSATTITAMEAPSALAAQLRGEHGDQGGLPPQLIQVGQDGKRIFARVQQQAEANNAEHRRRDAILAVLALLRRRQRQVGSSAVAAPRPPLGL